MILYIDTSALLKLYLLEDGARRVRHLLRMAKQVAIATVGYAEGRSGLARGKNQGRIDAAGYSRAVSAFEIQFNQMTLQDLTLPVYRLAGDLADKHLLRGFDAIHLASAVVLRDELAEPVRFLAFDDRLMAAAAAEGLVTA